MRVLLTVDLDEKVPNPPTSHGPAKAARQVYPSRGSGSGKGAFLARSAT
jgi:hypothetical protein